MELQELTKKNQEFIHTATNKLIQDGKSDEDIKLILEEAIPAILENQKKGVTARNLLGTPTAWAASFSQDPSQRAAETDKNTNPWLMWLDTSLLFIGIVALLNGIMTFFNTKRYSYRIDFLTGTWFWWRSIHVRYLLLYLPSSRKR